MLNFLTRHCHFFRQRLTAPAVAATIALFAVMPVTLANAADVPSTAANTGTAEAPEARVEFNEDGRRIVRLLELCTAPDTAVCDSYIDGFVDGYWLSNTHSFRMFPGTQRQQKGLAVQRMADKVYSSGICLPDGIAIRELRTTLIEYLRNNREEWKNSWYQTQLWTAFKTKWPCTMDFEKNTDTR